MDKEENVAEWMRYANMDLDLAKTAFSVMHPAPLEIICYHCQQAAEKFLKSLIIYFDGEPEKTHDLSKLVNVLKNFIDIEIDIVRFSEFLTQYSVHTRYPNEMSIDEDLTKDAIKMSEQIKIWAETFIADKCGAENETSTKN